MSRLGIDIHGVINKRPDMFATLTHEVKQNGHEIHILTGSKITKELIDELNSYDIIYDTLFSILDYHEAGEKVDVWQDSENNWWVDDDVWNKTKGIYCKNNNIDLHIDDTLIYKKYFETPFSLFLSESCELHYDSKIKYDMFIKEIIDILSRNYDDFSSVISDNISNELKCEKEQ